MRVFFSRRRGSEEIDGLGEPILLREILDKVQLAFGFFRARKRPKKKRKTTTTTTTTKNEKERQNFRVEKFTTRDTFFREETIIFPRLTFEAARARVHESVARRIARALEKKGRERSLFYHAAVRADLFHEDGRVDDGVVWWIEADDDNSPMFFFWRHDAKFIFVNR